MTHEPRRGHRSCRELHDAGFTLVEIVIAVVLSGIIAGVVVSTLITSLNAVDSTTAIVADATDQSLIATYLARDAQASAGTDPSTARIADGVGVSVPDGGADWSGCEQDGGFVVRFAWIDRSVVTDAPTVTSWAVHPDGRLVRRSCEESGTVDLVLGRGVSAAAASCAPDPACLREISTISLTVTGSRQEQFTLTASLRGDLQALPAVDSAAPVPLLVLGEQSETGACPVLDLAGKRPVTVLGDTIVSASCGASPIVGDLTLLAATGTTTVLSGVADPYADLAAPTDDCSTDSGRKPGDSAGADSVVVHTARVTVSGPLVFAPGRHVFCAGLELTSTAAVTGAGVLWYLPRGGLDIDPDASLDLTAATSGEFANLSVWSGGTGEVRIGGRSIDTVRGVVYAPTARVTVAAETAVHLGGIVAAEVSVVGAGRVRLGLPIPALTASPQQLPTGQVGIAYTATPLVVAGGTVPYEYEVTGLPSGLVFTANGVFSGTPTAAGAFTVGVLVSDATGVHRRVELPVTIRPALAVAGPASLPGGQAGVAYASTTLTASGGLAPHAWSASGVPPGMAMSASGVLSGRPTTAGAYTVVARVADGAGGVATRSYSVAVAAGVSATTPFAPAQRFQIVTESNAVLGSYGIDGAAAIGGDLTFRNYHSVAAVETSTLVRGTQAAGLVVGGTVDLAATGSGHQLTVGTGFLHVGSLGTNALTTWGTNVHLAPAGVNDNWTTPRVIVAADQSDQTTNPVVSPGAFDTASAFTEFRSTSARIAALDPATCSAIAAPTVTSAWGNYTLTLVAGRVNVWNLTLAQINAMGNVSGPTNVSADAPLVVNVTDAGSLTIPARYWAPLQNGTKSAIMWNFPNATAVNISGAFYGSILAPNAAVTIQNVDHQGDVVARTAVLTEGRSTLAHWTTPIPCTDVALAVYGPSAIADGQVGVASSVTLQRAGGTPGYTWAATGAPAGLTLSPAGVLSGTPTAAGTTTMLVTVTDSAGATASRSYPITIRALPAVASPASLPAGIVGTAYSTTTVAGSGGLAPYTWSATGLPAGLTLSGAGQLSGTPTANGSFSVVVTLRDATGATATRTYPLTVTGAVCPASVTGWRAEYFNSVDLSGPAALCRDDASIAFSWGQGAPGTGVNSDRFSVRWTRRESFVAGSYRFTAGSDDGLRLYVDGALVLDRWYDQGYTTHEVTLDLSSGNHTITYEVYENGGDAAATLAWTSLIPASCPTASPTAWTMEIYDGIALAAPIVDCRNVTNLNFNWGSGTPDSRVGNDTYSVRWTRAVSFAAGTYRFSAGSDDGVRLYVDGTRIIDSWSPRSYAVSTATVTLGAGNHTVVMEFYEQGGSARATLAWATV